MMLRYDSCCILYYYNIILFMLYLKKKSKVSEFECWDDRYWRAARVINHGMLYPTWVALLYR